MIGTMPRDLVVVSWLVPLLLKDLSRMPGIGSRPGARDVVTIAGEVGPTIVTMTSGSSLLGSKRSTDVMPRHAKPNVPYFVRTTGHAQIVYNGMVRDQSGVIPLRKFWGRRKYVGDVWEIQVDDKTWQTFGLPLFDGAK